MSPTIRLVSQDSRLARDDQLHSFGAVISSGFYHWFILALGLTALGGLEVR